MKAAGEGAEIAVGTEARTEPHVQPRPRAREPHTDWIHRAHQGDIERIEAFFHAHAYDMHRHDTYAIGRTLSGVQSFHYRRHFVHSQPGRTIVIHPDEPHDGEAGSEHGFRYRMVYVEPALFQEALGGRPLPFVEGGISDDPRLYAATDVLLRGMDYPLDPLERDDAILDLALALDAVSGARRLRQTADYHAARRAREYLHDALDCAVSLDDLAAATGRDRWSLSRDFRAFFGTSPYRYLTMRRLDRVRQLMLLGQPLAEVAAAAGFADQSHMTRHFTKTYGLSPSRWLKTLAGLGC